MYRINALNQSDSEQSLNLSISVLAEKAIEDIKHQYFDALKAKQNGHYDAAIGIFKQILQNDEIVSVTAESTACEQFRLKYCCYKNLAEIYNAQTSYRVALEMFLQAYAMDNTDVHFMSKFARIALEQRHMDLAGVIFKRCLEQNSNNMPSIDGTLEMLCRREDYFEAFGWAIYCHSKYPKYQRAIDVICDVYNILNDSPLLQTAFSSSPNVRTLISQRSTEPSLFPSTSHFDIPHDDADVDFTEFRMNVMPSFSTFGHMIELIYAKSTQVTSYLTTKLSLGDICDTENVIVDNNNTTTAAAAAAAAAAKASKPMSHNFDESCAAAVCNGQPIMFSSSPIQAIFLEIIPQYFSNSSSEDNDFDVQQPSLIRMIAQPNYLNNVKIAPMTSEEIFHNASVEYLYSFIDALKDGDFCMLDLMFEWLKWFSKCYHIPIPIELQSLYINIFEHLCNHIDYSSWERLSHVKICDLFAMEMFYIELNISSHARDNVVVEQMRFFDDRLVQRLNHASCIQNLFIVDCDPILYVRLQLLRLQMLIESEEFELANDLLNHIKTHFNDITHPIEIPIPNQMYCKLVDRRTISSELKLIKCLRLQQLWQQKYQAHQQQRQQQDQFTEQSTLDMLLMHRQCNFESKYMSVFQQYEMLVEWYWHAERFDDCLFWCEIGLHKSMQCRMNGEPISKQFLQHIRFLIAYLQHLFDENKHVSHSLSSKNKARLVRSMAHLLDVQYDRTQIAASQKTLPLPPLFNATKFVNILNLILNSDQHHLNAMNAQWAVLNIITKIAEWLILNNIPTWDDGDFLMCVWRKLLFSNSSSSIGSSNNSDGDGSRRCCNSIGPEFNWTEIIRLLSHSIYGYPNDIERHFGVCTCKRVQIDWNGATLLFISLDSISNEMSQLERKSLIDDLLNTIPDDLQMNLLEAISQLTNFLNDAIDFPHKTIPVRCIPSNLTEIFHRIVNIDMDMANYGPYNREQLIAMDLVINPQRFSSWLELLRIKISQFDKLYDAIDLTEINFTDVENAKNAIDTCFNKCQMFNRAETISTVDHLWYYGLYSYKLYNFFMKGDGGGGDMMRNEFNGIYTPKRLILSWKEVSKLLNAINVHLSKCSTIMDTQQKFRCYFILGKMAEKRNHGAIKKALTFYLKAEQQLFDQQQDDNGDDTLIQMRIEINFRITASIYKFIVRHCANQPNNANGASASASASASDSFTDDDLLQLMQVLQRDKHRLFTENQLAKRMDSVDENANKVNGVEQHQNRVKDVIKLCTQDFEWYLELWPAYYKAVYYLARINLKTDDCKCRALLLQLPRKANDVEKRLSLFDIHRNRHLFKVKKALQLDVIHNRASFNKYMEKCVEILIEHLATKRNPHLQLLTVALQWCRLLQTNIVSTSLTTTATTTTSMTNATAKLAAAPLNRQQINRLFELILGHFIATASTYVKLNNRNAAKLKAYDEFFQSLYELYKACEVQLCQSTYFPPYSNLMITCYRLLDSRNSDGGGGGGGNTTVFYENNDVKTTATAAMDSTKGNDNHEFQKALDFGAKKLNEKVQLQTDKNAKKSSNKDTQRTHDK